MKLRRRHIIEAKGDKTFQKCLAIALILKFKLKTSRIPNYSLNKLCKISGISHKTAEKYERWLLKYELIHFEGKGRNRVFIINSISSHTSNRNIAIEEIDFSNFFSTYRSLQSFIFMKLQHNKDFIQHLLQSRHNPESSGEFKKVKRKVKDLVVQGKLKSADVNYKEYGLSLKRIAKEIGCCVRTTQRVINYALLKQWVERQHNFEWFNAPYVNHREVDGFTFSTKHKLCIVHPNTYCLSPTISQALSY